MSSSAKSGIPQHILAVLDYYLDVWQEAGQIFKPIYELNATHHSRMVPAFYERANL